MATENTEPTAETETQTPKAEACTAKPEGKADSVCAKKCGKCRKGLVAAVVVAVAAGGAVAGRGGAAAAGRQKAERHSCRKRQAENFFPFHSLWYLLQFQSNAQIGNRNLLILISFLTRKYMDFRPDSKAFLAILFRFIAFSVLL